MLWHLHSHQQSTYYTVYILRVKPSSSVTIALICGGLLLEMHAYLFVCFIYHTAPEKSVTIGCIMQIVKFQLNFLVLI